MDRPWRELRTREHIELRFDPIADLAGGAIYGRSGDRAVIVLSPGLGQIERQCALAHELVHDELTVVAPPATAATMERIEAIARRRVSEWLVPAEELAVFVAARSQFEAVTAELVADEYYVTTEVALVALTRLSWRSGTDRAPG